MSKAADLAKFIGGGFSGKVLQVVSTNKTDKTDSGDFDASFENVSGLTVNITP